jgi:two-component sensor histidine kinase
MGARDISTGRAQQRTARRLLERLPLAADRPWLALSITLACVAIAAVLRWLADPLLPPGFPYVTFFPTVILIAFLFGTRMGTVAAVLCGVIAWHFFIPPTGSLTLTRSSTVALLFYAFVVGTDIALVHWMQRANRKLGRERELSRTLADTRELLFNELQHRVSNNLQVAAGLLSVQKRQVTDLQARAALDEAARRLGLIGRISRQLYDAAGATRNMREFLEPLCADVVEASGRTGIRCSIDVAEDAILSPDAAVPLALIVAEAMSNAIEHGFKDRDSGNIDVRLARSGDGMVIVEVRDDGHGLAEGFSIDASDSLGLRIATMLAGQLNGRFEMIGGAGTTARLVLPA